MMTMLYKVAGEDASHLNLQLLIELVLVSEIYSIHLILVEVLLPSTFVPHNPFSILSDTSNIRHVGIHPDPYLCYHCSFGRRYVMYSSLKCQVCISPTLDSCFYDVCGTYSRQQEIFGLLPLWLPLS